MFLSNISGAATARVLGICALVGFAGAEVTGAAFAGARITVSYDVVKIQVAPKQKTIRKSESRVYTLHGNQGDFSGSRGFKAAAGLKLGDEWESQTNDGRRFKLTYRILDGILFIVSDFGGYTTLRKIKTDQKSTCSSTLEYKKKAGHLNFDIPEQNATFSDIHAENVTCSIAETAD